jgi:hypothetical protein
MDQETQHLVSEPGRIFEGNIKRLTLFIKSPIQSDETSDRPIPPTKDAALLLAGDLVKSIRAKETVMMWAVPMLVTYAEAYLQDALEQLISGAFAKSTLPAPIIEEVTGKWIKSAIRSGGPHQWINHLTKFGVTGYPDDLAPKLQNIWKLRHKIIHSATPDASVMMTDLPLREIIDSVGTFVLTTDAFLVSQLS